MGCQTRQQRRRTTQGGASAKKGLKWGGYQQVLFLGQHLVSSREHAPEPTQESTDGSTKERHYRLNLADRLQQLGSVCTIVNTPIRHRRSMPSNADDFLMAGDGLTNAEIRISSLPVSSNAKKGVGDSSAHPSIIVACEQHVTLRRMVLKLPRIH